MERKEKERKLVLTLKIRHNNKAFEASHNDFERLINISFDDHRNSISFASSQFDANLLRHILLKMAEFRQSVLHPNFLDEFHDGTGDEIIDNPYGKKDAVNFICFGSCLGGSCSTLRCLMNVPLCI